MRQHIGSKTSLSGKIVKECEILKEYIFKLSIYLHVLSDFDRNVAIYFEKKPL